MARWNGGDAEHVGLNGLHSGAHHHVHHVLSRSRRSSFDGTVRLSDIESVGGLNHGVRCDSCGQVLFSLFGPAGGHKEANSHYVEDDRWYSISVW